MPTDINRVLDFLKISSWAGRHYSVYPPGSFQADRAASGLPAYRRPTQSVVYRALVIHDWWEDDIGSAYHGFIHLGLGTYPDDRGIVYHVTDLLEQLFQIGIKLYGWDAETNQFTRIAPTYLLDVRKRHCFNNERQFAEKWHCAPAEADALIVGDIVMYKLLCLYFGFGNVCAQDCLSWFNRTDESLALIEYVLIPEYASDELTQRSHRAFETSWPLKIPKPIATAREQLPEVLVSEPIKKRTLNTSNHHYELVRGDYVAIDPSTLIESHRSSLMSLSFWDQENFLTATSCFEHLFFLSMRFEQKVEPRITTNFFYLLAKRFPKLRNLTIGTQTIILPKVLQLPEHLGCITFVCLDLPLSSLNILTQIMSIVEIVLIDVNLIDDLYQELLRPLNKEFQLIVDRDLTYSSLGIAEKLQACFPGIELPESRILRKPTIGHLASSSFTNCRSTYSNNLDYRNKKPLFGYEYFMALKDNKAVLPHLYRIRIYQKVSLDSTNFKFEHVSNLHFQRIPLKSSSDLNLTAYRGKANFFHGCYPLRFNEAKQQLALPSLQSQERLVAWQITFSNSECIADNFEILYESNEGFYYLHALMPCAVRINFILFSPPINLPAQQSRIIDDIYNRDRYLIHHRLCAARTAIMGHALNEASYQIRAVANDIHMFLEIAYDNSWYSYHPAGGLEEAEGTIINLPGEHYLPAMAAKEPLTVTSHVARHEPAWKSCDLSQINLATLPAGTTLIVSESEWRSEQAIISLLNQDGGISTNPVTTYLAMPDNLNAYNKGLRLQHQAQGTITAEILTPIKPYSELREVVMQLQGRRLCVIVNLTYFPPQKVVQFNALFEIPARVQDIVLPLNTCVICIGVYSRYYNGQDFYRRILSDSFYRLNVNAEKMTQESTPTATQEFKDMPGSEKQYDITINLYGNEDLWITRLLGTINYNATTTTASFEVNPRGLLGLLSTAPDRPLEILIMNLPRSKEFTNFWYNLVYLRQIVFQGLRYAISRNWQITSQDKPYYLPPELIERCRFFIGLPEKMDDQPVSQKIIVLNAFSLMKYIQRKEPLLLRHPDRCVVYCTENFTLLQWSEFLAQIMAPIDIYLLQVTLQPWMHRRLIASKTISELEPWIRVYYSIQPYRFIHCLSSDDTYTIVLDGLEIIDLWLPEHNSEGELTVSPCSLLRVFATHTWRKLILVGTPTFEVAQYLQQFILKYNAMAMPDKPNKKVIIVTADKNWIQSIPHVVAPEEMLASTHNVSTALATTPTLDNDTRIRAVQSAFSVHPVVWIEGSTGVGKTSFAHAYLAQCFSPTTCHCYYELAQVERWLTEAMAQQDSAPTIYVLVINEGNLTDMALLGQLVTLYLERSYFIFNRKRYDLGTHTNALRKRLKVLITANPLDYGSGRNKPEIFDIAARIMFGPLSFDYIERHILLPSCPELSRKNADRLQELFEFAYTRNIIITPRELVTLGKMLSRDDRNILFDDDVFYYLLSTLFTKKDVQQFLEILRPKLQLSKLDLSVKTLRAPFKLLPSRQSTYDLLLRFLQIVQSNTTSRKSPQTHLPIFLLEGPAGCGKSMLIKTVLLETRYQIITVNDFLTATFEQGDHVCIHLPSSLDSQVKQLFFEQLLSNNRIPLLWIDEANVQELDEKTLNYVLDAGLHIVATQNPANNEYIGRTESSPALRHRSLRVALPEYTIEETTHF